MPITADQYLGKNKAGSVSSLPITTLAQAAAGSRIVVCVSWWDAGGATVSCSDGTAYAKDFEFDNGTNDRVAVFSRVLVGALASSSTITVSFSVGVSLAFAGAKSYLGTTGVDKSTNNVPAAGTAWSSGAVSNAVADSVYVGGSGSEASATTIPSSFTSGALFGSGSEDYDVAGAQGVVYADLIVSSIASQALSGAFNASSTTSVGFAVVYKGTAAAAPFGSPSLPFIASQGMTF